jgi:hypothetical protein
MRFEPAARLGFSRLEAGLVLVILVLFVLVLIPAFFSPKPLVLAPEIPEPPRTPSASASQE